MYPIVVCVHALQGRNYNLIGRTGCCYDYMILKWVPSGQDPHLHGKVIKYIHIELAPNFSGRGLL